MDPDLRTTRKIFAQIRTGTTWDECWIWTGYLDGGHPTFVVGKARKLRVRPFVRGRVHPEIKYGMLLPGCPERCVHPDHSWAAAKEKDRRLAEGDHLIQLLRESDNYKSGRRSA